MSATSHPGVHIGGVTKDGHGPVKELVNPATGEVIDALSTANQRDVAEATENSRKAQREWAKKTPGDRSKILLDPLSVRLV